MANEGIATELRRRGLRITPQRRVILAAFDGGNGHLTADEVWERARRRLPELSRATVYNVLSELVRTGLLQTVEGFGAARYERGGGAQHHHFRCLECGALTDVQPEGADRLRLPDERFEVRRTRVLIEGICPRCRSSGGRPSGARSGPGAAPSHAL